jgi:hypothetical protein
LTSLNFGDDIISFKNLEVKEYLDQANGAYQGTIHYLLLNPPAKKLTTQKE